MTEAERASRTRNDPATAEMAGTFLQFNLPEAIEQLRGEHGAKAGQNARTLVKYDDFRVVLITLDAGTRIPSHHTAGRVSIHTVAGHLRVHAEGRTLDLPTGSLVTLDRVVPHDVEAVEPSALLMTIAWGEEALDTRDAMGGRA